MFSPVLSYLLAVPRTIQKLLAPSSVLVLINYTILYIEPIYVPKLNTLQQYCESSINESKLIFKVERKILETSSVAQVGESKNMLLNEAKKASLIKNYMQKKYIFILFFKKRRL